MGEIEINGLFHIKIQDTNKILQGLYWNKSYASLPVAYKLGG